MSWGYNRRNWIEPFEALNNDFEFVYLFYMRPDDEGQVFTANRRIYYRDFRSPADLLNRILPDKVIFMGMDALQTIAINIECKRRNILTFVMVHGGATLSFADYQTVNWNERNLIRESFSKKSSDWLFTLKFLVSALGIRYFHLLPRLLRFQLEKTRNHPILALKRNQHPLRNPGKYLLYSEADRDFFKEQDNADPGDMYLLGNLEFSAFQQAFAAQGICESGYLLYLETPVSIIEGTGFDMDILSVAEYNAFLEGLNRFAMQHRLKLFIKLHPYSYGNNFMFRHDNIKYFEAEERETLILNSKAVIFFNSSLAIPAIHYKNCCMFLVGEPDEFQKQIIALNVCEVINYRKFIEDRESIDFLKTFPLRDKSAFTRKYIGENVDGKGLSRLKDILNADSQLNA